MGQKHSCLTRRSWILSLAGGFAGCSAFESNDTETRTALETNTGTTVETATTEADTDVIDFDGGGAAAFDTALSELAATPGGTLRIAPGTYRFDASRAPEPAYPSDDVRSHFGVSGLTAATITGPGPDTDGEAVIELTDPTRGFLFLNDAAEYTIRDLTVRHDPAPHTQGIIRSLSDDRRRIVVDLQDGFPALNEAPFSGDPAPSRLFANVFEQNGERVTRVTTDERSHFKEFAAIERVGDRRYELTLADGVETGALRTGRLLAIVAWHQIAPQFATVDAVRPTFQNVTLRTSPYRGFNFNYCERPIVQNCVVAPDPDGQRVISTNADVVHCNNCPVGPRVEGNRFERNTDDTVAVHNELMGVTALPDDRTVQVTKDFGTRVAAGDELLYASSRLERRGTLPPVETVDESGGPAGQTSPVLPETITFTEPVADRISVGDVLTPPRNRNSDTVVRGNTFRSNAARFVSLGGVDGGIVANNDFDGTHTDGVQVEAIGDTGSGVGAQLKGWSEEVLIRDNRIARTGLAGVPSGVPNAVFVSVDVGEGNPNNPSVSGRPHRNVTVENNDLVTTAGLGVHLADIQGATVEGNQIRDPGRIPVIDIGAYGLGLRHVADVTVDGNRVVATADDLTGFGYRRESEGVDLGNNAYVVAGENQPADLTDIGSAE